MLENRFSILSEIMQISTISQNLNKALSTFSQSYFLQFCTTPGGIVPTFSQQSKVWQSNSSSHPGLLLKCVPLMAAHLRAQTLDTLALLSVTSVKPIFRRISMIEGCLRKQWKPGFRPFRGFRVCMFLTCVGKATGCI